MISNVSSLLTGEYIISNSEMLICHRNADPLESVELSTWKEQCSINFTLRSFSRVSRNSSVHIRTNNFSTLVIIKNCSTTSKLQILAQSIFDSCKENFNTTKILWISRKENLIADEISKTIDYDTWRTIESFFQLTNIWGKVAFDRLADNHNTNI